MTVVGSQVNNLLTFIYSRAIPPIHDTWQKGDGIYNYFVTFPVAIF